MTFSKWALWRSVFHTIKLYRICVYSTLWVLRTSREPGSGERASPAPLQRHCPCGQAFVSAFLSYISVYSLIARFPTFVITDILSWIVFVVGNCFVHWRMFSSVPGLSMSVTTPVSRHCQKSQTFDKKPPAIKIALVESHLLNEVILEDERISKRTTNMCSKLHKQLLSFLGCQKYSKAHYYFSWKL